MAAFIWTILALCAAGVVCAEWVPMGAAFIFQPLRSFQFMEYIVMLYVAHFIVVAFERAQRPAEFVPATVAGLMMAYDASEPVRAAIVFLAAAALMALRCPIGRVRLGERGFVAAASVLVAGVGITCCALNAAQGVPFSASNAQDPSWLDIERWARKHTQTQDAFILPRDVDDGFRVESQRTVYADFKDGGLMNANPEFGIEWLRRMRSLEFDPANSDSTHSRLNAETVMRIARQMRDGRGRVFLVEEVEDGSLGFPVRYRNASYLVAEITLPRAIPQSLTARSAPTLAARTGPAPGRLQAGVRVGW
jgi:hypothetical protein